MFGQGDLSLVIGVRFCSGASAGCQTDESLSLKAWHQLTHKLHHHRLQEDDYPKAQKLFKNVLLIMKVASLLVTSTSNHQSQRNEIHHVSFAEILPRKPPGLCPHVAAPSTRTYLSSGLYAHDFARLLVIFFAFIFALRWHHNVFASERTPALQA